MTGINTVDIFLLGLPFLSNLSLTANTALGQAPGHLHNSSLEVDLWVVLLEPGKTQDHTLFTQVGDCKEDAF